MDRGNHLVSPDHLRLRVHAIGQVVFDRIAVQHQHGSDDDPLYVLELQRLLSAQDRAFTALCASER